MTTTNPTVCLSFDFDAISVWPGTMGVSSAQYTSRGEFAAEVGIPRVLDVLDAESLTATWFIPGADAELYPELCKRIRDSGHEIGHHGYMHETPTSLTEDEERRVLERGLTVLDEVIGVTPTGYRSPSADLSCASIRLLSEFGFRYDSSLLGGDFTPYRVYPEKGDLPPLTEVPIGTVNDMTYLEFVSTPFITLPANTTVDALGRRWIDDFTFMTEEVPGGIFAPVFHPQSIGRGSRITMLRRLITAAKNSNAEFTTIAEASELWEKRQGDSDV